MAGDYGLAARVYSVGLLVAGLLLGTLLYVGGHALLGGDTSDDAYILVPPGRGIPLWDYRQLPMRDCAWCRRTVNLNRHHVIPQAANPALRDVRENPVVLCRDCHFVLGHRCDWKQYNPDVLYICTHFTNVIRSADTRYALTNDAPHAVAPEPEQQEQPTNTLTGPQEAALERILENGKHDE